jgi:taurine dioxygenase
MSDAMADSAPRAPGGRSETIADERRIAARPLAGSLGAEIDGVDLARPVDDDTFLAIRRAFLDHQVIFFRDQRLTPAHYKAFARRFGELCVHRYIKGMEEHPEIMEIVREPTDEKVFAEGWHADVTYQECPVLGTMLYAQEVPPFGGDTLFANQYLAYETLSTGMRRLLDGLTAIHGGQKVYGARSTQFLRDGTLKTGKSEAARVETEHPVIRTHPETGRRALFVNPHYTLRFKGMTEEESAPLLRFLFTHAIQDRFTCRFRWAVGSLAFWDNRCTLHSPIDDYFGRRRHMLRVTVVGDRPV